MKITLYVQLEKLILSSLFFYFLKYFEITKFYNIYLLFDFGQEYVSLIENMKIDNFHNFQPKLKQRKILQKPAFKFNMSDVDTGKDVHKEGGAKVKFYF